MDTKRCPRCGQYLPVSEFTKSSKSKDGLSTYCKECSSEMSKQYRQNVKDRLAIADSKATKGDKLLSQCQPRDLLARLKELGYKWKDMTVEMKVDYDKI